jgi:hypothetical protein
MSAQSRSAINVPSSISIRTGIESSVAARRTVYQDAQSSSCDQFDQQLECAQRVCIMTFRSKLRRRMVFFAATAILATFGPAPARADRCDDIANQLKNQIEGLKVGITAANIIYLSHPAARRLSLGCRGRSYSNELYAKSDRRPKPEFYELVASAAAIIFTQPKDGMLTGATRCLKGMGLLRGDKINMRYRRLDMQCTRTKTETSIAISRKEDG